MLIPLEEVRFRYQIEGEFLEHLQDAGLLQFIQNKEGNYLALEELDKLEKILHWHFTLEINLPGVEVISNLLPKIENLQEEVQSLRNLIRFYQSEY